MLYYQEDRTHLGLAKTHLPVGLQKFAVRLKARFNPFPESVDGIIVMRWQRRLQSYPSEVLFFLVTRLRHVHVFSDHISRFPESACNPKRKSFR